MFGLFGKGERPVAPPTVLSDTIIPLNASDDTVILRSVCLYIMHRYDDVLDPLKLRYGLGRLVDRDGWRKLGGRLRLNREDKLEYHIPERFDEKRPAVSYSHVSHDMAIADHPLASRIPRATQHPSVLVDPSEFDSLSRRPDAPKELAHYIYSDEPQLALHVVSFRDATLVSLSMPHTLTDGTGGGYIYKAWSLALQGRDDEIADFHGYGSDPLAGFGTAPTEPYLHADQLLTGWRGFLFKLWQMWDAVRHRSEARILCMPAAVMTDLRQTAIKEIRAETGDQKAFMSDNDVLVAWFTRLAISGFPQNSNKTIRIMNAFQLVTVLADDRLPAAKAYVSNAAMEIYTFLTAREIFARPLSAVAYAIRQSMAQGGTRAQAEALAAIKRQTAAETGVPWPIFGDPSMEMMSFSNWSKGKYFETDMSAAVVRMGRSPSARANGPGIPSYIHFNAWSTAFQLRNIVPIFGKDAAGNYWLEAPLRAGVWDLIDKQLKEAAYEAPVDMT